MTGPDTGSPPSGPKAKPSVFLKLERKIATVSTDDVTRRWEYGRELLKMKAGKRKLPDGLIESLVGDAERAGLKVSRREIQYRVRCAEVYVSEAQLCKIICTMGTWSEIINAGFPEVIVDEPLFDQPETLPPPDAWEQLTLLPGFRAVVKVGGKDKPIAEMTVPEAIAYREKSRQTHESYGKWLAQVELTVDLVIDGWDGDPEAKALDAYNRAMSSP